MLLQDDLFGLASVGVRLVGQSKDVFIRVRREFDRLDGVNTAHRRDRKATWTEDTN